MLQKIMMIFFFSRGQVVREDDKYDDFDSLEPGVRLKQLDYVRMF